MMKSEQKALFPVEAVSAEQEGREAVPSDPEEALLLKVMRELEVPQPKRPLQCVTYKMPLPHYLRMKNVAGRWHLTYSDLLRLVMLRVTAALEEPNGELLAMLELHRQGEIDRRAARFEKRKRREAFIA